MLGLMHRQILERTGAGALAVALFVASTACGRRSMDERNAPDDRSPRAETREPNTEQRTPTPADAADVSTIDGIIAALYEAVSFQPGGVSDWDRLRSLFHPDGRLIPPRGDEPALQVMDVERFIRLSTAYVDESGMRAQGFHEQEIGRRQDVFGNVAQVFSAYASRRTVDDPEPFARGVNAIQLVRDNGRWWVLSIAWDVETPENPVVGTR